MLRLRRAVMLALVWYSRSSRAAAESPESEISSNPSPRGPLVVTSTDACLTPPSMVREIERFRARKPGDERLRIALRQEGRGVVAEIFRDGEWLGERPFPDAPADCGERTRLVGIALAVALERLGATASTTSEAPRPADEEPGPALPSVPESGGSQAEANAKKTPEQSPAAPRAPRTRSFEWTADVHGEASAGLFPTPGFGAGFSIGPRSSLGSIELGADARRGLGYALGTGEVDLGLLSASARGCLALATRRSLRLDGCLVMQAGQWRAAGRGYGRDLATKQAWLAASAGLRADLAVSGSVGLRLEVDAVVPVVRGSLEVRDGSDTLRAETTPVGVTASFGPALSF